MKPENCISFCVPAYNNWNMLQRCIDSIMVQNRNNYEIIITDDSDEDYESQINNKYPDNRIKYVKNTTSLGPAKNWNKAINLASNEYIVLLHQDDYLATNKFIDKIEKVIESEQPDIIYYDSINICNGKIVRKNSSPYKFDRVVHEHPYILLGRNLIGAPSSFCFKKDLNVLYDDHLMWLIDVDFYIRTITKARRIYHLRDYLVNIGIGEHQLTNRCKDNAEIELREFFYLRKKYRFNREGFQIASKNLALKLGYYKIIGNNSLKSFQFHDEYNGDYLEIRNKEKASLYLSFIIQNLRLAKRKLAGVK